MHDLDPTGAPIADDELDRALARAATTARVALLVEVRDPVTASWQRVRASGPTDLLDLTLAPPAEGETVRTVDLPGGIGMIRERCRVTRTPSGSLVAERSLSELPDAPVVPTVTEGPLAALVTQVGLHIYEAILYPDGTNRPIVWAVGLIEALGFADGDGPRSEAEWQECIHPEDRARYRGWYSIASIVRGSSLEVDYRVQDVNGAWRVLHERVALQQVRPDGSVLVRGLISDVTGQRALEKRVERVMQSLDVSVFEGIWYPHGFVETVSGGYLFAAFGFDRTGQSYTADWETHIHPDDRARYDLELGYGGLVPGRSVQTEYRILDAGGVEHIIQERQFARERLADGGIRVEGIVTDVTDRRQTERRLEALARSLNIHLFEAVRFPDRYEQLIGSPGALELLDLDEWPDDFIERWRDHIHPDERERFLEAVSWENFQRGRPIITEYPFTDAHGVERVLRHQFVPRETRADGGIRVESIVFDVTEQRATERRLLVSLDSLDAALFHGMIDADGAYHSIAELGSQNRSWFGAPAEGMSDDDLWRAHIHPDDLEAYESIDGPRLLAEPDGLTHEFRVIDDEGRVRYVLEQITPGRVLEDGSVLVEGITLDVTRQREALALAQAAERRLDDVMQSIGLDLYAGKLHADGRYAETVAPTHALAALGGLEPGEQTRALWLRCMHPEDRMRYEAGFLYERLRETRASSSEYRMADREGNWLRFAEHLFVREELAGGTLRIEGFVVDVTTQHQAEQKLAEIVEAIGLNIYAGTVGIDDVYHETSNSGILDEVMLGGTLPEGMSVDAVWKDRIHPEDREIYDRAYSYAAISGNAETTAEYRVVGYDGIERTLFGRNFRRGLQKDGAWIVEGVIVDVTAQASAARTATAAQRRLGEIVGSLDLWVYDGTSWPDRGFVVGNASVELHDMFGVTVEDPQPLSVVHERIHPDDRERYLATFTHEAYSALAPLTCEFRLVQRDGVERVLLEQAFPREPLLGGGVRVEGFFLDVTERYEARETESRLSRVLDSGDLLVTTFEHTEQGWNELFRGPGLERFVGLDELGDEDPWQVWTRLVHPEDRALREQTWQVLSIGEAADVRYRLRGLDGRERWVLEQLRPRPAAHGGARVLDSIISDVTDAQEATVELAQARDQAELRLRVDPLTGVSNRMHLVDQLEHELDEIREGGAVPAVVLLDIDHFKRINDRYLHSAGDLVLCEVAARIAEACRPQDAFGRWGGEEFVVIVRDAPTGTALRQIASRIRDAIGDVLFDVQGEPVRITASAGVARADRGTATVLDVFDAADRALYMAKRAGRDQLRMSEQVDERELLAGEPEVIRIAEAVSRAASAREGESELHCGLVARLAGEVGATLGLGPAAQLRCRLAGLMHDIGKMAVPDSILSKAGKLTDEEWEVMRHHAAFGAEIVSRIAGLADTAPAVHHHHERWDGKGYPDQLAGEAIPIEARIIAAVDSYCAMTEERVYRKALTHAEAVVELQACRGKQFDPAVADALIAVIDGQQALLAAA